MRTLTPLALFVAFLSCSTSAERTDPLMRAKAAGPGPSGQHHSFALTYTAEGMYITATVDTEKPEGERVKIQSSELQDDGEYDRIVKEMDRSAGRGYWCDEMLQGVGEDAEVMARTADTVTYTFTPQPTGARNDAVLEHMEGRITLDTDTAQIVDYQMAAPKPFRQALVAKITRFEMRMDCKPAPNGRTYTSDFRMDMAGSAAFKKFDQAFSRTLEIIK